MKPPTICGNAVSENLHALAADLVNPRGRAMDRWDEIRRQVETHKGSDLPRLNYEGVLEDFSEQFTQAADEIERLTAENEKFRAAAVRSVDILTRNLYHQREKCEDAISILRQALYPDDQKPTAP